MQKTREKLALATRTERFPYAEEKLLFDLGNALAECMDRLGVSRQELAERLGKNRSEVTKILRGRNATLRTVARCFAALDSALDIGVTDLMDGKLSLCHPYRWEDSAPCVVTVEDADQHDTYPAEAA